MKRFNLIFALIGALTLVCNNTSAIAPDVFSVCEYPIGELTDKEYFAGLGIGESEEEAYNMAWRMLTLRIKQRIIDSRDYEPGMEYAIIKKLKDFNVIRKKRAEYSDKTIGVDIWRVSIYFRIDKLESLDRSLYVMFV